MTTTLGYWDSQFLFSEILPDYEFCRNWMAEQSGRAASQIELRRETYGSADRQWFEMSGAGSGPYVPVFVHGGYWCLLEAEIHRFLFPGLARLGPVQANVEYRLMPGARLADLIEDVATALTSIARQTEGRLIVMGHSAGGHLAVTATRRAGLGERVAAVVPISGIFDLEPIAWSFLQNTLALTPDEIASSPLRSAQAGDPPTLVAVGDCETGEFIRQSEGFASRIGAPVLRVGGAHHMNVLAALSDPEAPLTRAIADFVAGRDLPAITEPYLPRT